MVTIDKPLEPGDTQSGSEQVKAQVYLLSGCCVSPASAYTPWLLSVVFKKHFHAHPTSPPGAIEQSLSSSILA